jgi:cytochrome o ubiquinol oxidase subunit III
MTVETAWLEEAAAEDGDVQFGFWLYLMSDAVLFGLLFATYVIMVQNTAGGPAGHEIFSLSNLSIQTAFLLTSTLTVAFAYQQAALGNGRAAVLWLAATCALGLGFLGLELRELGGLALAGTGPGRSGFLSAFFTLVGTHGMHVTAGVIWGIVLVVQLALRGPEMHVSSRLLRMSLFWHFLDIVWIGVFSVVYLPGILQ